jgi:hypothetical protein
MSWDSHGQAHTDSIGIFDDQDEWEQTQRRLGRLEGSRSWRGSNRHETAASKTGTAKQQNGIFERLAKFFGFCKRGSSVPSDKGLTSRGRYSSDFSTEMSTDNGNDDFAKTLTGC